MAGGQAPTITPGQSTARGGTSPAAAAPMVPFTRASIEHTEPSGVRSSALLSATPLQVGPSNIVAYGFMAYLTLRITASAGAAGEVTVAYQPDAPFSVLDEIRLQDINGTPIIQVSGYELMLLQKFGGYDFLATPGGTDSQPDSNGNFVLTLRIPVQLRQRDSLGCLPNMNAASSYQLQYTVGATSKVYSTAPTTLPNIAVECELSAWALPGASSATGQANAQTPPALGTTQYWTRQAGVAIAEGQNQVTFTRVGNLIRNIILVARNTSGVRTDASLLDSFQLMWDARTVLDETVALRRDTVTRRFGDSSLTIDGSPFDVGVMVLDFAHSFTGHPGDGELPDLWLPTASSTRLVYQGNAAAAGQLAILTNDVIPQGDIYSIS